MLRLAAAHADIWSWFVEERSDLTEFGPRLAALETACAAVGRDFDTIGRSAGVVVEPTSFTGSAEVLGVPIRGSAEAIADSLMAFYAGGFDHLEIVPWPPTTAALDALAPVLELIDSG
jgi:alkanesulfonate monooxygenase SsuD/methylene tetrahydromethanopterin reductase-like flavin-dependent oxidoreductase (luciferase family)